MYVDLSRFLPFTELFYTLDTRESVRWKYCMMIGLQDFLYGNDFKIVPI